MARPALRCSHGFAASGSPSPQSSPLSARGFSNFGMGTGITDGKTPDCRLRSASGDSILRYFRAKPVRVRDGLRLLCLEQRAWAAAFSRAALCLPPRLRAGAPAAGSTARSSPGAASGGY